MTIFTQIKTILLFFAFGNSLYIAHFISHHILKKELLIYSIVTFMTLIFMIILYNSNNGQIHFYFIISMFIGVILSKICVNKTQKYIFELKSTLKK